MFLRKTQFCLLTTRAPTITDCRVLQCIYTSWHHPLKCAFMCTVSVFVCACVGSELDTAMFGLHIFESTVKCIKRGMKLFMGCKSQQHVFPLREP